MPANLPVILVPGSCVQCAALFGIRSEQRAARESKGDHVATEFPSVACQFRARSMARALITKAIVQGFPVFIPLR
jgi:hypothetical protein